MQVSSNLAKYKIQNNIGGWILNNKILLFNQDLPHAFQNYFIL